jgi:hypothetical protein
MPAPHGNISWNSRPDNEPDTNGDYRPIGSKNFLITQASAPSPSIADRHKRAQERHPNVTDID